MFDKKQFGSHFDLIIFIFSWDSYWASTFLLLNRVNREARSSTAPRPLGSRSTILSSPNPVHPRRIVYTEIVLRDHPDLNLGCLLAYVIRKSSVFHHLKCAQGILFFEV